MAVGVFWHFGGDADDCTGDDSFFPQEEMALGQSKRVALAIKICSIYI